MKSKKTVYGARRTAQRLGFVFCGLMILIMAGCGGGSMFQGALPMVEIEYEPPDIVTEAGVIVDQGRIIYKRKGEQAIAGLNVQLDKDTKIKLDQAENTAADQAIQYMAPYMESVMNLMTEVIKKVPPMGQ